MASIGTYTPNYTISLVSLEERGVKREGANVKVKAGMLAGSEIRGEYYFFHVFFCVSLFGSPEVIIRVLEAAVQRWSTSMLCVPGSRCCVFLFFFIFLSTFPSCHRVSSSQMDAVKQHNDACSPSWVLAIAAVYMQSNRRTSCNTHPHAHTQTLIYIWVLWNYTNMALVTVQIKPSLLCN